METYNYSHFKPGYYTTREFAGPKAGERYQEMELFDIHGKRRSLSQYIGRQPIVLETVSGSSPTYAHTLPHMRRLQMLYPDVLFLVMYVRETHPGAHNPAHQSLAHKLMAARDMVVHYEEKRTVLIDDLEGTSHRAYGGLPHMVYVFDEAGKVVFRADWNRPGHLAYVLKELMKGRRVFRRDFFAPAMPGIGKVWQAMRFAGPFALWQFMKSIPRMMHIAKWANLSYAHRNLV